MIDREQLLRERARGIGGSDVPRILGLVPFTNALDVYHQKTRPYRPSAHTIDTLRGIEHEPNAISWYWKATGRRGRAVKVASRHPDYPAFLCHTDGEVFSDPEREPSDPESWNDPTAIRGVGTLELKCPRAAVFTRVYERGLRQSEIVQTETYMAVQRRLWGGIGYYSMEHDAGPILPVDLEADTKLGDFLLEVGQRFWDECVVPRIPPDPTEWALLARDDAPPVREKKGGAVAVVEDAELAQAAEGLVDASSLKKRAEELIEARKKELRSIIDARDYGDKLHIPGVGKVTTVHNSGFKTFSREALEGHMPIDRDKFMRWVVDQGLDEDPETVLAGLNLDLSRFERQGDPFSYVRVTPEKKGKAS